MAEAFVNVTEGSGKKLHAWDRSISGNTVLDEFVIPGEYPLASYVVIGAAVSIATANDHILCCNAGSTLPVRVRRIWIEQSGNATTAAITSMQILRTTTAAPTGGTAVTPAPLDTTDSAAGAAGRTLPTAKGTESTLIFQVAMVWRQAVGTTTAQVDDYWEWVQKPGQKPIIIPAGTANGLVIKSTSAVAGATVNVGMEIVETNFV